VAGDHDADRLDLIDAGVRGIEGSGEGVEAGFTREGTEFGFQGGSVRRDHEIRISSVDTLLPCRVRSLMCAAQSARSMFREGPALPVFYVAGWTTAVTMSSIGLL